METLALLFALAFSDPIVCVLQGYVYHDTAQEPISWTSSTYCPLKVSTDETQLVVYSPNHWATIKIPVDKGNRRFQYRFGSDAAHLEAETIPVLWGTVNRG